jgi:hypothetical protein
MEVIITIRKLGKVSKESRWIKWNTLQDMIFT